MKLTPILFISGGSEKFPFSVTGNSQGLTRPDRCYTAESMH